MERDFGGFKGVLIIGLGLIGGSIAVSLKKRGFKGKIYGFDLNLDRVNKAVEIGAVDKGFTDYSEVPWENIDLVIISTPVKTFTKIATDIKKYLKGKTLVTDVGSVKGDLVKQLEEILKPNIFIGGHPIAGTEKEGVENAVVDLFNGKKVILTIDHEDEFTQKLEKFWVDLGSKVEVMDPYLHDFVFAAVSHLPHAVAFSLVDTLIELSDEKNIDLFLYPGAGFKDFTRIAASSPTVWKDIFIQNKKEVLHTIDKFIESMNKLRDAVEKEEEEKLLNILYESRERRLSLD
ncbi:prephenate dehydrogenase [Persephonella sp.]